MQNNVLNEMFNHLDNFEKESHFYYRFCEFQDDDEYIIKRDEWFLCSEQAIEKTPDLVFGGAPPEKAYNLGYFFDQSFTFMANCFYFITMAMENKMDSSMIFSGCMNWLEYFFKYTEEDDQIDNLQTLCLIEIKHILENPQCERFIKLNNLIQFIKLCAKEKQKYCNEASLILFCNMNSIPIKQPKKIPFQLDVGHISETLTVSDVKVLLDREEKKAEAIEQLFDKMKSPGKVPRRIYSYYEIYTYTDFLLATLLEIINAKKVINICKVCGRYFIPRRRNDTAYCYNPSMTNPNNSCYKQYKIEQQLIKDKATESNRVNKSIRTMMEYRFNYGQITEKEFKNYKVENKKWGKDLIEGMVSEEEYLDWLYTFYKKKKRKNNNNDSL